MQHMREECEGEGPPQALDAAEGDDEERRRQA